MKERFAVEYESVLDQHSLQHKMLLILCWEGSQGKSHCIFIIVPFTLSLSIHGWLIREMWMDDGRVDG